MTYEGQGRPELDAAAVRRHREHLPVCVLALLPAALVFALAADALYPLVLAVGLCSVAWLLPRPLRWTTRSGVYGLLLILVTVALADQISPISSDRFFLLPGNTLGPLAVGMAGAILLFELRPEAQGGFMVATAALLALGGNRMLVVSASEHLSMMGEFLPDFWRLFPAAVFLDLGLFIHLIRRMEPVTRAAGDCQPEGRGPDLRRWLFSGVAVLMAVGAGVILYGGAIFYERYVFNADRWVSTWFFRNADLFFFRKSVDLWQTSPYLERRDMSVVIRVISRTCPGYLRGRAYTQYAEGRWFSADEERRQISGSPAPGRLTFSTFQRSGLRGSALVAGPGLASSEVHLSSRLQGDVLPVKGDASGICLTARELFEDESGTLMPEGWTRGTAYTFQSSPACEVYPLPAPADPVSCLQLPAPMERALAPVVAEFRARPGGGETMPARFLARDLCSFLDDRCRYSLDIFFSDSMEDPVIQFLNEKRQGHCEMFATAAVLLLRAQGVPARYVTGFVCEERGRGRGYWVSRLADAHAWAEAWSPEEKRWFLVEATPDSGLPDARNRDAGYWSGNFDRIAFVFQRFYSWLRNGYFADFMLHVAAAVVGGFWWLVANPWRVAVLLLVLLAAGIWLVRRAWRRFRAAAVAEFRSRHRLRHAWQALERHLARQGLSRPACMTAREFAEVVTVRLEPAEATGFRDVTTRFEELRYAPEPPAEAAVAEFAAQAAELRNRLHPLLPPPPATPVETWHS